MNSIEDDIKEITSGPAFTSFLVVILILMFIAASVCLFERHKIKTEPFGNWTYISFSSIEDLKVRLDPSFIPGVLYKFEKENPSLVLRDKEILWNYVCGYPYGLLIRHTSK